MTTPKPPPVPHHINCVCGSCREARAAEARRRIEEQRRDAHRVVMALREEEAGRGVVFAPLKKAPRGSVRRIVQGAKRRVS